MEDKLLIDLSIEYGLDDEEISKIADLIYQCEIHDLNDKRAKIIAEYIIENELLEKPDEEIIEELKREDIVED